MRSFFAIALFSLTAPLYAKPYTAFQDGESFSFRVGWGVFGKAGLIQVKASKDQLEGKPVFRVQMVTESKGVVRGFYHYEDVAEAVIDAETGRILRATEVAKNSEPLSDALTRFDYEKREATHEDKLRPGRNRSFPFAADSDPVDLISALVQTREWADKMGVSREVSIFAGRDIYPVVIRAEKEEELNTPQGTKKTLVLCPRMEKGEARGIFKKGGEVKVWVSQDTERLPVRMQLRLKFGTAILHLIEHKLPSDNKVSPGK